MSRKRGKYVDGEIVWTDEHGRPCTPPADKPVTDDGCGGPSIRSESSRGWPITSESAAVHPKQVAQFEEHCRERGVPTEFRKTGEPVFRSLSHQREHLKIRGMHNRDDNA